MAKKTVAAEIQLPTELDARIDLDAVIAIGTAQFETKCTSTINELKAKIKDSNERSKVLSAKIKDDIQSTVDSCPQLAGILAGFAFLGSSKLKLTGSIHSTRTNEIGIKLGSGNDYDTFYIGSMALPNSIQNTISELNAENENAKVLSTQLAAAYERRAALPTLERQLRAQLSMKKLKAMGDGGAATLQFVSEFALEFHTNLLS